MASSKISALTSGGGLAAADAIAISRAGTSFRATPMGMSALVYRYTVSGSDKASIDTGVDTADAGSNDWTGGDLLEVFLMARGDEASVRSTMKMTLNNDTGANYDLHDVYALNATVATDGPTLAAANWGVNINGANCAANFFSSAALVIPDYAGTVAYKRGTMANALGDSTAANVISGMFTLGYRSTSAITRLAITPSTAGKKLKVGSQLLIYKRLAS